MNPACLTSLVPAKTTGVRMAAEAASLPAGKFFVRLESAICLCQEGERGFGVRAPGKGGGSELKTCLEQPLRVMSISARRASFPVTPAEYAGGSLRTPLGMLNWDGVFSLTSTSVCLGGGVPSPMLPRLLEVLESQFSRGVAPWLFGQPCGPGAFCSSCLEL